MNRYHWNAVLGAACCLFALVLLLVWIPADVASGVIEQVRRQVVIGDALAPTVWSTGIGLLGLLLLLASLLRLHEGVAETPGGGPTWANLRYLLTLLATIVGALLVMTHAGPWVVGIAQALGSDVDTYRSLRATRPWKYIGYLAGGFLLVFALMSYTSQRISLRLALIAAAAVLFMAMAYDLPFKNLLLPPNGDQ